MSITLSTASMVCSSRPGTVPLARIEAGGFINAAHMRHMGNRILTRLSHYEIQKNPNQNLTARLWSFSPHQQACLSWNSNTQTPQRWQKVSHLRPCYTGSARGKHKENVGGNAWTPNRNKPPCKQGKQESLRIGHQPILPSQFFFFCCYFNWTFWSLDS